MAPNHTFQYCYSNKFGKIHLEKNIFLIKQDLVYDVR